MNRRTLISWGHALAVLVTAATFAHSEPVTVQVTDKVLVRDTVRLGINLCSDNYWDCAMLKVRAAENFEGLRYRMMTWGPQMDQNGIYVWFRPTNDPAVWAKMKGVVRYTLLTGPEKGRSGLVKDIREQVCPADRQKRKLCYIEFDRAVQPLQQNQIGVMLELDRPNQGSIRDNSNPAHWNSLGNTAHLGDVPAETFGDSALWLKGTDAQSHYAFGLMFKDMGDQNGTWRVRMWTKRKSGTPQLTMQIGDTKTDVPLTNEWVRHDLNIPIDSPQRNSNLGARLVVSGGDVLVDDIEIWKEEASRNPTVFRDLVVDPLKKLNPGILRFLQMGGSDMETNLRPALRQMGWTRDWKNLLSGGRNRASQYRFNLHEFYVLCEYIGADPWYCLPGTVHPREFGILMEYLAAPADVGYGKVRAELGHPKPWTDVFRNIYVEVGNEAWNSAGYATGSYNGPDHWKDLFAVGKASAHYRPNILFVAGSQAGNPGVTKSVLNNVPNCDRVGVAPYIVHKLPKTETDALDTDAKLFTWIFGFTARRVLHEEGHMRRHDALAGEKGVELAIYEHNYHMTGPAVKDGGAPIDVRNRVIASLGGGINLVNDSLLMMREFGLRSQCLFNLNQKGFREGVKLWGFMPGLNLQEPRYRPSFLATEIANHVIAGDLVETIHSTNEPTFTAKGVLYRQWGQEPRVTEFGPIPAIRSYAFRDGELRGLILFNLDVSREHAVRLTIPGAVTSKTAKVWRLTADSIAANNEYETGAPQVRTEEKTINGSPTAQPITLPAHSMLVLQWQDEY